MRAEYQALNYSSETLSCFQEGRITYLALAGQAWLAQGFERQRGSVRSLALARYPERCLDRC